MDQQSHRVLIIDKLDESREVLRTMLRRSGLDTIEAKRANQGLEIAKRWHPHIMVLDSETLDLDDPSVCDGFRKEAQSEDMAVVFLGRIPWAPGSPVTNQVVAKPYHYRSLIRRIEELLDS